MSYSNSVIFGPIPSRRFGISLGIDLSPSKKQCNFDCLYCELEKAKTIDTMNEYPSVEEIVKAVKDSFENHERIDVLTVTANGEPTLYPNLSELIDEINKIKGDSKTLILSNGGKIYEKEIQDALLKFDTVKLSLDCISDRCFKKLDRVDGSVDVSSIVQGMVEFKKRFKNFFVLEILFVEDLNDDEKEIELLYNAIKTIEPNRVDIGTIDRPPAYKVKPVSYEFLESVAQRFVGVNVNIAYKNRPSAVQSYSEDEILTLLKRRPLTKEDIENMFDDSSKSVLNRLYESKKIELIDSGGVEFYKKM